MNSQRTRPKKDLEDYILNGKLPPMDIDLEEAIVGGLMLERDTFHKVESIINAEDFYKDEHKEVFKSIKSLSDRNQEYDIINVVQDLRSRGLLDKLGGPFGVTQLTQRIAGTHGIEGRAKKVKEFSIIRNVINICGSFAHKGFEPGVDAFELVDQVLGELENVSKTESTVIQRIGDVARATLLKMKNDSVMELQTIGLPSSIKALTEHTLGYIDPDLIILSAKSGEGKTTFAFQEAYSIAKGGEPTAFISMEMKGNQLCWKTFSSLIEEEILQIRLAKNISDGKWVQLDEIVKEMEKIPLYIIDATGLNINQITALTKELKRKHNLKMLFIDYIQLISGGSDKNFQNREGEMAYVSRKLKENCMKMSIPTMALSQLTLDKESKRIYVQDDLRESKAIGHNADGVLFLYWPDFHKVETINNEYYGKNESIIVVEKWRLGARKLLRVKFFPQFNKFEDMYKNVNDSIDIPGRDIKPYSEPIKEDSSENLPF